MKENNGNTIPPNQFLSRDQLMQVRQSVARVGYCRAFFFIFILRRVTPVIK